MRAAWISSEGQWVRLATASILGTAALSAAEVGLSSPSQLACAIGFASLWLIPAGFIFGAGVIVLWRAWAPIVDDCPRAAAWSALTCTVGILASSILYRVLTALAILTKSKALVAVMSTAAATGIAIAAVLVWVALSRPAERTVRRFGPRAPAWLFAACGALLAGFVVFVWRVVVTKALSGHFDIGVIVGPLVGLGVGVGVGAAWHRLPGRRTLASCSAIVILAGAVASGWSWHRQPRIVLDVWGSSQLLGALVDATVDIDSSRHRMVLAEQLETVGKQRSVVLVTIDTLRVDRMGWMDGPAKTPNLDKFMDGAAAFEWAIAPGNVTRRSLTSMMTGVAPDKLRGRISGWALKLDPRHIVLSEWFSGNHYRTAGFFCCGKFFDPERKLGFERGLDDITIDMDGAVLVKEAVRWIEKHRAENGSSPFFVWVHLIEPHSWNDKYKGTKKGPSAQRRYDKVLRETDALAKPLLDQMAKLTSDTVVVVTSDHGESLGERGAVNHGSQLTNAEIRVPYAIAGPGVIKGHYKEVVSLVGLSATVLELAGFRPPASLHGTSIASLVRGERKEEAGTAVARMIKDRAVREGRKAIVIGRYKYLEDGRTGGVRIFDIRRDPGETRDLAKKRPELLKLFFEHTRH